MTKHRLIVATALIALLAVPFLAQAARPGGGNPADLLHNPRALARYLKLTPAQIDATKVLVDNLRNSTKGLHDQIKPLEQQLKTQLGAASPDACAVGATVVKIDALRDKVRDAVEDFDAAFSALLTPEQLAKYEALKDLVKAGQDEED